MDDLSRLDWSLIRAFLAVAETGSLSAAARKLDASQPTLGRQIKTLEKALGADLFHRQPRGLVLTTEGQDMLPAARDMAEAMNRIAMSAAGREERLSGPVRITASVAVSVWHLPPILAHLRQAEPEITIDLVPTDQTTNLTYREADIAVRMYRPTQLDLVTRHLGDVSLSAYAARSYISRRGLPKGAEDVPAHDFIGFDTDPIMLDGFRAAGFPATRDWFQTRTDDVVAGWELMRAGCGIGFGQRNIARRYPDLVELDFGFPLPKLPVWLTAHQAMRNTPRIRRVWDTLAEGLAAMVDP